MQTVAGHYFWLAKCYQRIICITSYFFQQMWMMGRCFYELYVLLKFANFVTFQCVSFNVKCRGQEFYGLKTAKFSKSLPTYLNFYNWRAVHHCYRRVIYSLWLHHDICMAVIHCHPPVFNLSIKEATRFAKTLSIKDMKSMIWGLTFVINQVQILFVK